MGKILIGNNKSKVDELKNHFVKYGFKKFNEQEDSNIKAVFFNKLKVHNYNFLNVGNDFIATSGTIIYKKIIGEKALQKIFKDFTNGFKYVRDNALGDFCVVIKRHDKLYIFTDRNAIQDIYYYNSNDWMVTNTFYHLGKVYNTPEVNKFEMIEYAFQHSIIGNKTPYKNIFKLMGNEYIEIDLIKDRFTIRDIFQRSKDDVDSDISTDAEKFAQKLKQKVTDIAEVYDKPTISMTGGLDSRIMLSAFLGIGKSPQLTYGVGDCPITNTRSRDLEINELYSERFDLNFYEMNWRRNGVLEENWLYYLEKYGEMFTIYAGNKNIYEELENNITNELILFGYYGETLRNRPWIEYLGKSHFTLDEYINEFYVNKDLKNLMPDYEQYKNYLRDKLLIEINSMNLKADLLQVDDFLYVYNSWFLRAHNVMNNFNNQFRYSIDLLADYDINSISKKVSFKKKEKSKYMLEIINYLFPEILNVPFYTHGEEKIFNPISFELETSSKKENTIKSIKSYVNRTKYGSLLKKVYIRLKSVNKKSRYSKYEEIRRKCEEVLYIANDCELKANDYTGDINCLVKYTQLSYMNRNLLKKGERI